MKKRQEGFSVVPLLVVVIVVALIGVIGWRVLVRQKDTNRAAYTASTSKQAASAPHKTESKPIAWLTYKNEEAGMTFQYPSNWTSQVADTFRFDDGSFGGVSGTVTSPSGNKMTWAYNVAGGKGGDCEPETNDIPFATGNKCSSREILSVEKIPSVAPPTKNLDRNLFEDSLYIIHTKYRANYGDKTITYQICLDPYYDRDQPPAVGTYMGLLFPCQYWSTGFNVKFEVPDIAGFGSADAKTAEQIMRSFNSL